MRAKLPKLDEAANLLSAKYYIDFLEKASEK